MRLLNVVDERLESFFGDENEIPPYGILSHRWGKDEITFQDLTQGSLQDFHGRQSFSKIWDLLDRADKDGLSYVWIDTCCIDKSSSAELSEAINSMFRWYQQSKKCYVYLDDFDAISNCKLVYYEYSERTAILDESDNSFFDSLWFTRGWTLQELIAPRNVEFYDKNWISFGSRDFALLDRICHRTGIWPQLFREPRCACPSERGHSTFAFRDGVCVGCHGLDTLPQTLDSFAVSIKMSWASSRITTRKEDAAYCLLGLFNLNMPLLYGEGDKAFLRLQEAIVRQSKDQSVLLWRARPDVAPQGFAPGCLAPSSSAFKEPVHILGRRVFNRVDKKYEANFLGNLATMEITDTAIRTSLWICPCKVVPDGTQTTSRNLWLGIMQLAYDDDYLMRPALLLEYMGTVDMYRRVYHQHIVPVNPRITQGSFVVESSIGEVDRRLLVTPSLDEATKKDISILLQQSPINATAGPSPEEGPETGPVYFVLDKQKLDFLMDSGGSHPPFSRYLSRTTQIPSRWAFKKCQHEGDGERYFGGIHFVNFMLEIPKGPNSDQMPNGQGVDRFAYTAIIWGIQREVLKGGRNTSPWHLWCRVFNLKMFTEHARTSNEDLQPNQLYREIDSLSAGEIQGRMENQRSRLCLAEYEKLEIPHSAVPRALFPSSYGDNWSEDNMETSKMLLAAKVVLVEGLGRKIFELHIKISDVAKI
ncbi:heterokaryon incompatibility protein-domain-containing protein [Fusarium redolens]|uniref:Heterokaryon incompatibility protein-domain-containing protein n=1 Tax=Fusarium redolens TaxID=48865 RepID=A0A9P9HAV0_FUSRE|nr:heterokaryon incompatibility protein-domain-containing protein [Fusarium redolens]KAH7254178.1 heterokaryon incompatibility protein-domain-containing protein [Fusarium redolens]